MANFNIETVFHLTEKVALAGKVESGIITPGMKVNLEGNVFQVKRIESQNQEIPQAYPGDAVGLVITALQAQEESKKRSFWDILLGLNQNKAPNFGVFEKYIDKVIDVS